MGIPYHPGIKATADGMATHILSCHGHGQSQTNAVNAQDNRNSVLGPAWCFAGTARNNDQLRCLTLYGTSDEYCKTNDVACCQKVFFSSTITQGLTLLERLGT
ncbi:hypothetical protein TNCV_1982961 [Trichonephila clavipes]|nr:hypothetical protein TNCV_1982961 [Trichonephila clavipes]